MFCFSITLIFGFCLPSYFDNRFLSDDLVTEIWKKRKMGDTSPRTSVSTDGETDHNNLMVSL